MARTGTERQSTRELAFIVAGTTYGLPAERVLEVIRAPALTRVPLAANALAGVINFHGVAVPVADLGRLLDATSASGAAAWVIVYRDSDVVGLLVDDVLRIEDGAGRPRRGKTLDIAALLDREWHATTRGGANAKRLFSEAPAAPQPAEAARTLLGFFVGGQRYALAIEAVREVLALPSEIAPLAGVDAAVLGLVSLKDMVVPLISLAGLLGIDERESSGRRVVVIPIGEGLVGLVTGAMEQIVRLPESAIEPVPPVLQRGEGDAEIDAIGRLDGGQLVSILSPNKLFGNRIVASAVASVEQKETSMPAAAENAVLEQFVVLELGDEHYGLPIAAVDEIVKLPEAVTRLPKAPAFVAGVINLRGWPLPVIDQRRRFDTKPSDATGRRSRVVVITVDGLRVGFIVDGVSEILRLSAELVRPAPELPGEGAKIFDRIAPLGRRGEMLLLVDPRQLLDSAERDLLAALKLAGQPAGS